MTQPPKYVPVAKEKYHLFGNKEMAAREITNLNRVMIHLYLNEPVYAGMIIDGTMVKADSGTAGITKNGELILNEKFLDELTPGQRITLMKHEAWHKALGHHVRMADPRFPDAHLCNVAMDAFINAQLERDKAEPIPDWITPATLAGPYKLDAATVKRMERASWEEIYFILDKARPPQDEPEDGDEEGEGQPGQGGQPVKGNPGEKKPGSSPHADVGQNWGNVEKMEGQNGGQPTPEEVQEALAEAAAVMEKAIAEGILAGQGTTELMKKLREASKSKLDWRSILRQEMAKGRNLRSYTWARMPRRLSTMRMPAPVREGTGKIIVLLDKSGSITEAVTKAMLGFLNQIIDETQPDSVVLVPFDDRVKDKDIVEFPLGEQIDYLYVNGGGTCFRSAFNAAAAQWQPGDKVVMFTDMECSQPERPEFADSLIWVGVDAQPHYAATTYGTYVDVKTSDL
jgi:predicted metal-dependent peptidase